MAKNQWLKVVQDTNALFEAGMDADAWLKFAASSSCDLAEWAKLNEPDAYKSAFKEWA